MDVLQNPIINCLPITVSAVSFILGLIFILKPALLANLSKQLNRSFSTEKVLKSLEKTRERDASIIKKSKPLGMVFMLLTLIILLQMLNSPVPLSLLTFALVVAVLGLIFILKPALLANLSKQLNRSFSTEKLLKTLEKTRDTDGWIINNSRVVGIVFVILAVIVFLQIITW